jgi:hypothetical protein
VAEDPVPAKPRRPLLEHPLSFPERSVWLEPFRNIGKSGRKSFRHRLTCRRCSSSMAMSFARSVQYLFVLVQLKSTSNASKNRRYEKANVDNAQGSPHKGEILACIIIATPGQTRADRWPMKRVCW